MRHTVKTSSMASFCRMTATSLLVAAALGVGASSMAQPEPTLSQVYAMAQAGRNLDQAQLMMQKVLSAHPNSAEAHFAQAELHARRGELDQARESLATAEKFSPSLGFAKPEAVQALRTQLSPSNEIVAGNGLTFHRPAAAKSAEQSPRQTFVWGLALLLIGLMLVAVYFILRRRMQHPDS